jgi:nucleotidyltransferase/DNA polymerase involved in DNA repair
MKHALQTIPGVGKSIQQDLLDLGIKHVEDLRNKNPQKLYGKDAVTTK